MSKTTEVITHTVTLTRRSDGRESSVLDVTGWNARDFERMWDGLVMKVDFEVWEPVYSPPRGEDQTVEEWLR